MLIIGELINSTREEVKEALQTGDEGLIRRLAREQLEAGADVLDINTATQMEREVEALEWVIGLIHDELGEVRLALDSPNPQALAAGLSLCKAQPLINSINNEPQHAEAVLPLIKEYDAEVIGLTMGGAGMPQTVEDRLKEAEQLVKRLDEAGIDREQVYLDPLAMSIGSNQEQGRMVIETVRLIKQEFGVKTSVGLSNVSFGLPDRSLINRVFLAMLLEAGIDAALIDPTDKDMMDTLRAAEALLGVDRYCLEYIKHKRRR